MKKEFTQKQLEIMKVLKEVIGITHIACDKEYGIHGYNDAPSKDGNVWDAGHKLWRCALKKDTFPQIVWEDTEAVKLDDYLMCE